MDVQQAVDNFNLALKHCDNIVAVHRAHGGAGRGRRFREVSLDRAVIVLAVAAWQAAIQDLTIALLDTAKPTGPAPIDIARYNVITGPARKAVGDFATPNANNTRKLMMSAGFDPRPHWTWVSAGGRGRQPVVWNPNTVDARLDEWLKVRHALAHGHESLPVVQALLAVRVKGVTSNPTLQLEDAEACVRFLNRLVKLTATALARELTAPLNYPRP
jgi:hypothetical protein